VRNNLATVVSIDNLDSNVVAGYNVGMAYGGPVFGWYDAKGATVSYRSPGTYGNANIIVAGGSASEFVNFDPSTLTYNMMLKKGAPAIGAGAAGVPTVDILGVTRVSPYTAGAYSYPE
jgi:hypothetical protein